jgi:hypothetical protein
MSRLPAAVPDGLQRSATKNGKSTTAAPVALYLTFFDNEPGAEGYTIATKRDQAKIVFNDAKKMVEASGLKSRISLASRTCTGRHVLQVGAARGGPRLDGRSQPALIVIDEFHAHKDRGLIDVMETATGARRQPVFFGITTAGNDPVSPCGDQHDYACKILDDVLEDETFFAFIAHADETDEWQTSGRGSRRIRTGACRSIPTTCERWRARRSTCPRRPRRSNRSASTVGECRYAHGCRWKAGKGQTRR